MPKSREIISPVAGKLEDLGNDVTREWALDGKAVIFHLKDISRPTLDAWVAGVTQTLNAWTNDTMYIMYDFAVPGMVVFSPYLQSRAKELSQLRLDLTAMVAVV